MLWKGFQRPKRLEFERETATERFGRFYAQPFERGFGTTIGIEVKSIRDVTPIPHNGCRPPKRRRV